MEKKEKVTTTNKESNPITIESIQAQNETGETVKVLINTAVYTNRANNNIAFVEYCRREGEPVPENILYHAIDRMPSDAFNYFINISNTAKNAAIILSSSFDGEPGYEIYYDAVDSDNPKITSDAIYEMLNNCENKYTRDDYLDTQYCEYRNGMQQPLYFGNKLQTCTL